MSDFAAEYGNLDPKTGAFTDIHPPLDSRQAVVEADRCFFCHDAPCMTACPTSIDIPLFIRQIAAGNAKGAAETILDQNIMGAVCARVCPTEVLCEGACVRHTEQDTPIKIGQLQRYATDALFAAGEQPFKRAEKTGKSIGVIGGGPAGLACAHGLARRGYDVTIYEARDKLGGLNEYGIAAYKVTENIAQREVDFILEIGGIEAKCEVRVGVDITLDEIRQQHDALFIGLGMNAVNVLGLTDQNGDAALKGVYDAVDYIARLRQSANPSALKVGRDVVVIGGGMTAIDIAIQSKKLGAENVTMVYRRGQDQMNASTYEQQLAQINGVKIKHWSQPSRFLSENGRIVGMEFEYTRLNGHGLEGTGEMWEIKADMVFAAIGQKLDAGFLPSGETVAMEKGRFKVDAERKTSLEGVWAGGDCISEGEDLTVAAVEDGKIAADSIHRALMGQ